MKHRLRFISFIFLSILFLLLYEIFEINQFTILSILFAISSIAFGINDYSYLSPIKIFISFTGLYVLIDQIWLLNDYQEYSSFFRHEFFVTDEFIRILPIEMVIISISLYVGTILYKHTFKPKSNESALIVKQTGLEKYWLYFYLSGLFVIAMLLLSTNETNLVFENINNRRERAAGRGVLVILTYLSYLGVLLWYKNKLDHNKYSFLNFIKLVFLLSPMLLLGSRTEFIMVFFSTLYMSTLYNHRLPLKRGMGLFLIIIIFLAAFQGIRSGTNMDEFDFYEGISKDLSMGVGYALADQNGFFTDTFNLQTLALTFTLFIPSGIKAMLTMPISPNNLFTISLYQYDVNSTVSMGLFGEARYLLPDYFRIIYYVSLGIFFSWSHLTLSKKHIFSAAVITGATIRLSKGGITAAIPNILNILILYFIALMIIRFLTKAQVRN